MGRPNKKQGKKKAPVNDARQQQNQQPITECEMANQTEFQPCPNGALNLQFSPMDTWFFRESRPHDAVGASELSSLFPPPVRTLIGAVRSFLGEQIGIDWQALKDGKAHDDFKKAVGDSEKLGDLSIRGAWVCQDGQRLYPAPCYLMHKKINNEDDFVRLQIGNSPVECDLGNVRLPELPKNKEGQDIFGYKGLEQTWITSKGWQQLLQGKTPSKDDVIKAADLFDKEARLGIARDNASRSVLESKLYQTQHIRLKENVTIQLDVHSLSDELVGKLPAKNTHAILRLGGEGRMAALENRVDYQPLPRLENHQLSLKKIIIHFITAADFGGEMFPETFEPKIENGKNVWRGEINGVTLIIESAVIGKVHREGGWDMQNHRPRAVKSYIPAGSAWFCRMETELSNQELDKLNGHCIGNETEWGRGQILIGVWHDNQTEEK